MTTNISNVASTVMSLVGQTAEALTPTVMHPGTFQDVMNVAKSLSGSTSEGGSEVGGVNLTMFGEMKELIDMQIQMQKEMQTISMVSNIEKSRHESKMAAIRNIRAS